jgi:cardiolipin synthase
MPRRRQRFRHFKPMLRPIAGSRLPRELRVNRVGRLAEALPLGIADPGFETLLRRIDRAPFLGGNEVEVYTDGQAAFAAMRDVGLTAEREVLLESYIFKDDRTGRAFLSGLQAAAGREVTVRVLADALGSAETRKEFWQAMEDYGVQVRLFHPLFQSLWYQPFRDHRKILVIDREVAFTGGMNIGEEYGSPRPKPGQTWRDTHVRVTGPTAWEMAVVFSEGWEHSGGEPFEIDPLPAEATELPGSRILVLDSAPQRGQAESASALAAITAACRKNLWITNAYFAPARGAIDLLGDAAQRGVRRAGHGYYAALLERGVRIFEYQPSILHAKTLVADGLVSVVGSTNLDFRSFIFNSECDLLILCPPTAATLEQAFLADLEQSEEIRLADWRRRPLTKVIGDRMSRWLSPLL